jgi:HEAT repeat protein
LLAIDGADMRRLCADALGRNAIPGSKSAGVALLKALNDEDASVRRSVALAMSRINAPGAADALANTLIADDGKDVCLRDGLVRAVEGLGAPGLERLTALADSGVQKDLDRVVEVFAALRTRPAAEAAATLLKNPHLSIEQRAVLVRSYSNYQLDPPLSLEPLLDYLTANPDEAVPVRLAALEALSAHGVPGDRARTWLLSALDDREAQVRLSAIQAAADARLDAAVPKLASILEDGRKTAKERATAATALRALRSVSALPALRAVVAAEALTPETAALRLEALRTLTAVLSGEAIRNRSPQR